MDFLNTKWLAVLSIVTKDHAVMVTVLLLWRRTVITIVTACYMYYERMHLLLTLLAWFTFVIFLLFPDGIRKKHCSFTDMIKEHTLYNSSMWNNNAHIQGDRKCNHSISVVRMANPCVNYWRANVWIFGSIDMVCSGYGIECTRTSMWAKLIKLLLFFCQKMSSPFPGHVTLSSALWEVFKVQFPPLGGLIVAEPWEWRALLQQRMLMQIQTAPVKVKNSGSNI